MLTSLRRPMLLNVKVRRTAGPHSLTVKLFEDNAKETGLVGVPLTIASVVREKFAWKEIATAVTTFVIAAPLFWQG